MPSDSSPQYGARLWLGPLWSELLIVSLPIILYIILYPSLPDNIAIHFDIEGNPNGYAHKDALSQLALWTLWIFIVGKLLRGLILFFAHWDKKGNNFPIAAKLSTYVEFFLLILTAFLNMYLMLYSESGRPALFSKDMLFLDKITWSGINILFIILGNFCPKLRPNKWIGIRTPYAFSSEDAWNQVQRFGGRVMVGTGILNLIVTLLIPSRGNSTTMLENGIFLYNMAAILAMTLFLFLWKPGKSKSGKNS